MKILMLCLEFPPVNTTGNYRSGGFARHLCNSNIETVVLTGTVDTLEKTFGKKSDQKLLSGLEPVKIHRFPILPFKSVWSKGIGNKARIWWNTTDKMDKRWYIGDNKKQIDALIENEKPDVLYVSLPPFSMARVAIELSIKFNLPLVTDMRDAWSLWVSHPFYTRFHYKKIYNLEKKLFKQSSLIIGVTPELVDDFRNQHKEIEPKQFKTIFNGYDNLDLEKEVNQKVDDCIRIGYVGSFYYHPDSEKLMNTKWYLRSGIKKFYYSPRNEQWKYRSPYFFLLALSKLLKETPELKSKIIFEYIGNEVKSLNQMIEELDLKGNFTYHGFVTKQEVINIQNSWDAILATSEKVNGGMHFCLPSKVFDVVRSKKLILGFLTSGSQYNFLKNYKQVKLFNPDEPEINKDKLKDLFMSDKLSYEISELSKDFYRTNLAENFLDSLKKIVKK